MGMDSWIEYEGEEYEYQALIAKRSSGKYKCFYWSFFYKL